MLKTYKYNALINFSAEVFMCDHHQANNGLNCWELRLLVHGKLIDAYHWHSINETKTNYREKDTVLVVGNWATKHKLRFQIIRAEVISYLPANDELFFKDKMPPLTSTFTNTVKVQRKED